jgi:quercetin dioxygenase-like cupin family protein
MVDLATALDVSSRLHGVVQQRARGDAMSLADTQSTAGSEAEQGKADVFANLGSSSQGSGKRMVFFDLHATDVVAVVDAEQYCEYPDAILESDVDLHAFHEGTCDMQILYADPEGDGLSLGAYSFPANFTFPRHWHDSDQIIFVLDGVLKHGNKHMHPGEGYFTRAGVTYTFTAGPAGVKFLEFRPKTNFRTVMVEDDPARWIRTDRTAEGEA